MAATPWRVALVASSSWSHAFLTPKQPSLCIPTSRPIARSTSRCGPATTRPGAKTPLASLEESGQQEMLNWMCLAGAMAELQRRPASAKFIETYIFNSSSAASSA